MEEKNEWVFFKEIDWNCPKNNKFNIDTRDFHCGYNFNKRGHKDYDKLKSYKHFFFTETELKELIENLYNESGGNCEWRMLSLESSDNKVLNWNLKYLRIWRTDIGFIICNSEEQALSKELLECKVNKEYL